MNDARVEAIVRHSAVYRAVDAAFRHLQQAWVSSTLRRTAGGVGGRIRFWALATAVAAAAALVLAPYGTTPAPLGWIVPLTSGAVALVIFVLAPRR